MTGCPHPNDNHAQDSHLEHPEGSPGVFRRVQVAVAKLRVALDERLGRPSPAGVKAPSGQRLPGSFGLLNGTAETPEILPSHRPASVTRKDRRVQIAAAKARVTLDKRLGIETPDWIIALSRETPE